MSAELTAMQREALDRANHFEIFRDPKQIAFGFGFPSGHPLQKSYRVWNQLVGFGYLEQFNNSDQVRGERRAYWSEYKINDAGRAAIASKPSP